MIRLHRESLIFVQVLERLLRCRQMLSLVYWAIAVIRLCEKFGKYRLGTEESSSLLSLVLPENSRKFSKPSTIRLNFSWKSSWEINGGSPTQNRLQYCS